MPGEIDVDFDSSLNSLNPLSAPHVSTIRLKPIFYSGLSIKFELLRKEFMSGLIFGGEKSNGDTRHLLIFKSSGILTRNGVRFLAHIDNPATYQRTSH